MEYSLTSTFPIAFNGPFKGFPGEKIGKIFVGQLLGIKWIQFDMVPLYKAFLGVTYENI